MNKKQAEQEILRRLENHLIRVDALTQLIYYDLGKLPKQELIKMITVDEDGNLLSEPENYEFWIRWKLGSQIYYYEVEEFDAECQKYFESLKQATEILNCYDGE